MTGAYELMDQMCKAAGIDRSRHGGHGDPIAVSEDGKYSIEFVECLASCGFGPVCMINDDFYESVKEEEVPKILEKYA